MSTNRFQDPFPNINSETITSAMSEAEVVLSEKFDPLSPDIIENTAGFIVRAAIDIGRYQRSIDKSPDRKEHYNRLIRCAATSVCVRVCRQVSERGSSHVTNLQDVLEGIDWSQTAATPVPRVSSVVPADGTEPPYTVQFISRSSYQRQILPA